MKPLDALRSLNETREKQAFFPAVDTEMDLGITSVIAVWLLLDRIGTPGWGSFVYWAIAMLWWAFSIFAWWTNLGVVSDTILTAEDVGRRLDQLEAMERRLAAVEAHPAVRSRSFLL